MIDWHCSCRWRVIEDVLMNGAVDKIWTLATSFGGHELCGRSDELYATNVFPLTSGAILYLLAPCALDIRVTVIPGASSKAVGCPSGRASVWRGSAPSSFPKSLKVDIIVEDIVCLR